VLSEFQSLSYSMPERVHRRFDDETDGPPPAKKARIEKSKPFKRVPGKPLPDGDHQGDDSPRHIDKVVPKLPKKATSNQTARLQPRNARSLGERPSVVDGPAQPKHGRLRDRAQVLLAGRQKLPIWTHQEELRNAMNTKDVMLLVGETGSGKSTQVPQFLVQESWCQTQLVSIHDGDVEKKVKVGGCIAITQPRRVAAISLARRVAEEFGTPLGSASPASTVGYSVRFDNCTSPCTKIKFLTEGMLLQEMLRDPWLRQYSAVIVDEVHERSVNVDLVLGFLRNMVTGEHEGRGGVQLKVAVMSATADLHALLAFFSEGFGRLTGQMNGTEPRSPDDGADNAESDWSGLSGDEVQKGTSELNSNGQIVNGNVDHRDPHPSSTSPSHSLVHNTLHGDDHISICHIKGRQFPVKVMFSPRAVDDIVDAALRVIFQINYKEPLPGDILVFLTGQETVESLEKLVNEYSAGLSKEVPKMLAIPLFAALPQAAQQKVFHPAPFRTRKVIIATNIAETSVTVPGVRHVVDCGKSKIKQFRSRVGLESLLCKPISKSAAIQRQGRAGREAPGHCYRLYSDREYEELDAVNTPEILRCDIAQAVLTMKARGIEQPWTFPLLDPPPRESLEKGLVQLFQLDALEADGTISKVGLQMAELPLSAPLGRVLLTAAEPSMDCLSEAIDIISCLNVEAIFLNPTSEESKEAATRARQSLYRREGDHLTLLGAMQAYTVENADRRAWCEQHFVSHRAMRGAWDVRKQLRQQARLLGFQLGDDNGPSPAPSPEKADAILRCFLRGFGWKTALLCADGGYRTIAGKHEIAIHPSSVLAGRKVEAIMYNEFVFTNRSYARGVSAVQTNWVVEVTEGQH